MALEDKIKVADDFELIHGEPYVVTQLAPNAYQVWSKALANKCSSIVYDSSTKPIGSAAETVEVVANG